MTDWTHLPPVEPHARQRTSVTWPDCVCGDPAARHDLTSDDPPNGRSWLYPIEPCEVDGCTCEQYEPEVDR